MYSAQHPMHGTSFQEYAAAPLPGDLAGQGLNEAQWDKALMARGIGFVLAEPGRYVMLSLSRVRDYFEFWPTADSSLIFNAGRVLSIALFLPFMLYGIYLEVKAKVKAQDRILLNLSLNLNLALRPLLQRAPHRHLGHVALPAAGGRGAADLRGGGDRGPGGKVEAKDKHENGSASALDRPLRSLLVDSIWRSVQRRLLAESGRMCIASKAQLLAVSTLARRQ